MVESCKVGKAWHLRRREVFTREWGRAACFDHFRAATPGFLTVRPWRKIACQSGLGSTCVPRCVRAGGSTSHVRLLGMTMRRYSQRRRSSRACQAPRRGGLPNARCRTSTGEPRTAQTHDEFHSPENRARWRKVRAVRLARSLSEDVIPSSSVREIAASLPEVFQLCAGDLPARDSPGNSMSVTKTNQKLMQRLRVGLDLGATRAVPRSSCPRDIRSDRGLYSAVKNVAVVPLGG
jgi:hypothetical protein